MISSAILLWGARLYTSPVVSVAGLFDFCQKNIHRLEAMLSLTNSFATRLLAERSQLCLFYNPPHYLLWRYNYSCMLGWILQTVEREQCFMIVMQVTALHTVCFPFTRSCIAQKGEEKNHSSFLMNLLFCGIKVVFTQTKGSWCSVFTHFSHQLY